MRILIDECLPRPLKREFPGHDAWTVPEMGWAGKKDHELLPLLAPNGFEVLITADQNIRHQQNLPAAGIAVLVLAAGSNRLADLVPLVPQPSPPFPRSNRATWSKFANPL